MSRCFMAALALLLVMAGRAQADTVVIDFQSPLNWDDPNTYGQNFSVNGFRFSPRTHVDIVDFGEPGGWNYPGGSTAMGWDSAGDSNPNFFGTCGVVPFVEGTCVYVDRAGQSFSFVSFIRGGEAIEIESSKGGYLFAGGYTATLISYLLEGPEWQDVQWLTFREFGSGAPQQFVDDLTFSVVPIPPAIWLVVSALGWLGWLRRRALSR